MSTDQPDRTVSIRMTDPADAYRHHQAEQLLREAGFVERRPVGTWRPRIQATSSHAPHGNPGTDGDTSTQ